jgi:glycine cleavage system H protein
MTVPNDLRYSTDHEWIQQEGNNVRVGITYYAQDALGDVVFVELPTVGDQVVAAQPFGEVESTKSVSEIFSPLDGKIVEINDQLSTNPELINTSPYEKGWLCVIEIADISQIETLLSPEAYRDHIHE